VVGFAPKMKLFGEFSWEGYMGRTFHRGIVCGWREFSMEGKPDFLVLFKA